MFSPQDIKNRCKQQPFVPFRILTSGGQTFDVTHPDLVWVGVREVRVGTADAYNPSFYDTTERIALIDVTGLMDLG